MRRVERAVGLLDKETRDWLLRNVKLRETSDPMTGVTLTDDGYVIFLGSELDEWTDPLSVPSSSGHAV